MASGASAHARSRADAGACATNAQCVREHGGEPWICAAEGQCAPLASEDCKVLAEPSAIDSDHTLWIGTLFPVSGERGTLGQECTNVVELARRELTSMSSGLPPSGEAPGAPLGIVACDDTKDSARAAVHLTRDVHVPAVIGFGSGNEVMDLAQRVFLPSGTLMIATLNHNPAITKVPEPPGPRLVWRLADGDGQMPEVLSLVIGQVIEPDLRHTDGLRPGEELRAAAILEETPTGLGTEGALLEGLRLNDRRALDDKGAFRTFRCSASGASSNCERHLGALLAFRPHVVILGVEGSKLVPVLRSLEEAWPKDAGFRPRYLEDASLRGLEPLLDERPDRRRRFFGFAPKSSDLSAKLARRYEETFRTRPSEPEVIAPPYDAFYLVALAAFASREVVRDGATLAGAFPRLLPPGSPVEVGPSGLLDAYGILSRGGSVALTGTSALLDMDPGTGERRTDFDVLCPGFSGGHVRAAVPSGLRYDHGSHALTGKLQCP